MSHPNALSATITAPQELTILWDSPVMPTADYNLELLRSTHESSDGSPIFDTDLDFDTSETPAQLDNEDEVIFTLGDRIHHGDVLGLVIKAGLVRNATGQPNLGSIEVRSVRIGFAAPEETT